MYKYTSPSEININAFSSLLDFVPPEKGWAAKIKGLRESYIKHSYFVKNDFMTWEDAMFLLDRVQENYGIILKPDLFDMLIVVSRKNQENSHLADICMHIPLSYINSICNLIDHEPLSACLGELFSNDQLECQMVKAVRGSLQVNGDVRDSNKHFEPLESNMPMFYEHSLPMVSPPQPWVKSEETGTLSGGYLSKSSTSVLSFNAIRSKSYAHLFLSPSEKLLEVLNGLQKCSFKINKPMLDWVLTNKKVLIQQGILVDPHYVLLDFKKVQDFLLKKFGSDSTKIANITSAIIEKKGQALTQELILKVANIFRDLPLWFPCFLDFRGRIYRSGYPSIQGGGLSRSLLLWDFSEDQIPKSVSEVEAIELLKAIGFAVKKHETFEDAILCGRFYLENRIPVDNQMDDPFSYASLVLVPYDRYVFECDYLKKDSLKTGGDIHLYKDWFTKWLYCIPARKDASASVFQIMSILSNEYYLAMYSNILSATGGSLKIKDLYTIIYDEFIIYMKGNRERILDYVYYISRNSKVYNLSQLQATLAKVYELLDLEKGPIDRKLLKSIIMPYCYNVTVFKASKDVSDQLIEKGYIFGNLPVGYLLTKLIFWFIEQQFNRIVNLKELLSGIGELAALFGISLYWKIGNWAEVCQQYIADRNEKVAITVKQGNTTKRSGFNYKKSLFVCDTLKAKKATPANQVHSIDAHAMYIMMDYLLEKKVPCAGIHDCVVTTWLEAAFVAIAYYNTLYDILKDPIHLVDQLFENTFSSLIPNTFFTDGVYDIKGFLEFLLSEEGQAFLERKFLSKDSNQNLAMLEAEKEALIAEISSLSKKLNTAKGKNGLHIKYLIEAYMAKEHNVKDQIVKTKKGLGRVIDCITHVSILYSVFVDYQKNIPIGSTEVLNYMKKCKDEFKQSSMF